MTTITYRYLAPSAAGEQGIQLHTSGGRGAHPLFFAGFATEPLAACRGILALAEVASSDFAFRRPPSGIDPVVTAGQGMLRLESVSRCAGVYARLDLLPASLDRKSVV